MKTPRFFGRAAALAIAVAALSATRAFAAAEADLLVSYDQTHASSVGGQDNANVSAANAVAGCNAIHERSGTGAKVRIVGYYQCATYNYQTSTKGGYVNWMASYDSHLSDVVDVANARGADLVTFICVSASDGAAAVAQQPGRYSAFDPGSFWSAVVAHELGGHNFGCDHRGGCVSPKTIMLHNYCGGGSSPPYIFSNPNIWLNSTRLLGAGSCLGDAVSGGDNAYLISTTAQDRADSYGRVIAAPNLANVVRRWQFNKTAGSITNGTTVADSVSGALATVSGAGATYTGDGLRLPGGSSGSGAAYVQLPAGVLSGYSDVTVEFWAKAISAQNWARLLDFNGGTTSDYIMLASSVGTDLNSQRFESVNGGTKVSLDSGIPTEAGVLHHYAITYASTGASAGRWTWYRDGDEIAYLDVAYALSALKDTNNWLGRSAYSGDAFANCEFAEIRISNVAMTRDQLAANARLGPNRTSASVTLTGNDAIGSASFNAAGLWSDGLSPSNTKSYETYGFRLRTPADGTSRTFAGQSLKLTGGSFTWKGTSSSTVTATNLTLAGTGGEVLNAGSGTFTLAGNLRADADETQVRAANGAITISANLSGAGSLLLLNNTVKLSGSNTNFTGKISVGDGRFSSVAIDSEARLGTNPATFTADQLTLNRGILYCTNSLVVDDANRGIRVGASAALFNVATNCNLTVSVPLSGVSSGSAVVTNPIYPNPAYGMLIKENSGTLTLTHANNSHVGEIVINGGALNLDGAGRINNGDDPMPVVNNGTFNVNTSANQSLGGAISGGGALNKLNSGTLTLTGANPMTGPVTVSGGTLYARTGNAANGRACSYVSGITVNTNATLRSSANALFGWDGTQEKPVTVNAGATLLADGGLSSDVGVGLITLNGGALATATTGATDYGSWRFDDAGDKLLVTDNATASAANVKFGNADASIEVAAGKVLTFSGTITDATAGGISYLQKTGAGTLLLSGSNSYTGATSINGGTVILSGSLAAGTAVTVTNGATLTGTGTINGALTLGPGATHAAGAPTGTQTVKGALAYQTNAVLLWRLATNSAVMQGRVAAGTVTIAPGAAVNVTFNGAGSIVNFSDAFWQQSRSWVLMTQTNRTGTFAVGSVTPDAGGRPLSGYGTLALEHTATAVNLVYTPYTPTQTWQQAYFGNSWTNAAIAGDAADADGDGLSNILEYALGSDPTAFSASALPQTSTASGRLRVSFTRNSAATDVTLSVMASDSSQIEGTEIARSTNGTAFTALLPAASVIETNAGSLIGVQATDIYTIGDTNHPSRFMRIKITR